MPTQNEDLEQAVFRALTRHSRQRSVRTYVVAFILVVLGAGYATVRVIDSVNARRADRARQQYELERAKAYVNRIKEQTVKEEAEHEQRMREIKAGTRKE